MRIPVPDELLPADGLGRVHFVGIGGAALSGDRPDHGRARRPRHRQRRQRDAVPGRRCASSGCRSTSATTPPAPGRGRHRRRVHGRPRGQPRGASRARRRGLRLLPRSAGLASVMAGHDVLAVAGTHGKTTTTSLLTIALLAAGADPTYAIGRRLAATGHNADAGAVDLFVAEADESDGAFLVYSPTAAIVTNVDADHLDQWGTEEAYRAAFVEFLDRIDPGGLPGAVRRRPRRGRARRAGPRARARRRHRRHRRRGRLPRDRAPVRGHQVRLRRRARRRRSSPT